MDNILAQIIQHKIREVEGKEAATGLEILEQLALEAPPVVSMVHALKDPSGSGIIAEFKRMSPSGGTMHNSHSLLDTVRKYIENNASGVSILTDEKYFGGSEEDLYGAKQRYPSIPMLRKEFIIDPYQIIEARALGADAILLIAAILDREEIRSFTELAHALDMEVILEVHHEHELDKYYDGIDIIGVNNRNLTTFQTDIRHSIRLLGSLPANKVKISESGIRTADDAKLLLDAGYDGLLIGSSLMQSEDPGTALQQLISRN